jgi:GDP-D-mannose 3',5'-epimerase
MKKALILGGAGFIGSHLAMKLKDKGYHVRCVDIKRNRYFDMSGIEFIIGDLRNPDVVDTVIDYGVDEVYQLAALMGGAGYIFTGENDSEIFYSSAMINLNVAQAAVKKKVKKLFFSSSACIYSQDYQKDPKINKLSEDMAYPANPDSDYGWEKLLSERLYLAYARNHGLNVRIARFHNIMGTHSDFFTGKEKAPGAICRKVLMAKNGSSIDIWGTGDQVRTFLYIDDCLDAVELLMNSNHTEPINIGSEEAITINDLAKMAIKISGKSLTINNIEGPVGVAGRSSDNTVIKTVLGWSPKMTLNESIKEIYQWMDQYLSTMKLIMTRNPDTNNIRKYIFDNTEGKIIRYELKK